MFEKTMKNAHIYFSYIFRKTGILHAGFISVVHFVDSHKECTVALAFCLDANRETIIIAKAQIQILHTIPTILKAKPHSPISCLKN